MELTYEELRRIQQKERSSGVLVELPSDFYGRAVGMVKEMRDGLAGGFSLDKAREYENALKVLRDIYSLREQKLLMRALRGASSNEPLQGVSIEEQDMFEKVRIVISDCEAAFESSLNGAGKAHAAPKPAAQSDNRELKILSEVPQFVGVDGKTYGPFKADEAIILPVKVAELLLKRKLASD